MAKSGVNNPGTTGSGVSGFAGATGPIAGVAAGVPGPEAGVPGPEAGVPGPEAGVADSGAGMADSGAATLRLTGPGVGDAGFLVSAGRQKSGMAGAARMRRTSAVINFASNFGDGLQSMRRGRLLTKAGVGHTCSSIRGRIRSAWRIAGVGWLT